MDTEAIIAKANHKQSQLCVGLDPRCDRDQRLEWALNLIKQVGPYAIAFKPNRQFWLGASLDDMQRLTKAIHEQDAFAIIDHKLSDIGSSNAACLQESALEGFDAITVSPFPGNLEELIATAELHNLSTIGLVLMSNPESAYMVQNEQYLTWAKVLDRPTSGMVLGTTGHVTEEHLRKVAAANTQGYVLAPGLGSQGGAVDLITKYFDNRVLFNVSRSIAQAEDVVKAAKRYQQLSFNH